MPKKTTTYSSKLFNQIKNPYTRIRNHVTGITANVWPEDITNGGSWVFNEKGEKIFLSAEELNSDWEVNRAQF